MKTLKKDWEIIKYILLLFLGWKIALTIITFLGLSIVPYVGENAKYFLPHQGLDYWIRWSNWDGGHFRGIAENNYLPLQTVFFPLYPLLIKTLMILGINSVLGGIILSNFFLILSLYFLYKLSQLDFDKSFSKNVLFILLIFPTSFYFSAVYSESLFLFLTLASFYFTRTKNYSLSFIFASLSTVTRLAGLIVLLSVFIDYLLEEKFKTNLKTIFKKLLKKQTLYLIISLIPICLYIFYQKILFNNPFSFLTNEELWDRHFSLPWEPIILYISNFFEYGLPTETFIAHSLIELSSFFIATICLYFSFKLLRPSYSLFFLLTYLLPLFSSTLSSYHRYILVIFPLFFILGKIKNELLQKFLTLFSIMLLSLLSILFINSYWVT